MYSKDWPNTGKAEVEFRIAPMRDVYLNLFIDSDGQTLRKDFTLEQLVEKMNDHEWELEFAYRYDGYEEVLYKCFFASLYIGVKEIYYRNWADNRKSTPKLIKRGWHFGIWQGLLGICTGAAFRVG